MPNATRKQTLHRDSRGHFIRATGPGNTSGANDRSASTMGQRITGVIQTSGGSGREVGSGPIRRRPGRPRKDESTATAAGAGASAPSGANESGAGIETGAETAAAETQEGFTLTQATDEIKNDRPKRKYTTRKSARAGAISDDAALSASILIGVLDSAAQALVGEMAALTLNERNLIEEPLARIMDRLSPEVVERIQKFSDPMLLLFGLGLWGMRLYKINAAQAEARSAQEVPEQTAAAAAPETVPDQSPNKKIIPDDGKVSTMPLKSPDLLREVSPI